MNLRLATEIDSKALLLFLDESNADTNLTVTVRERQTGLFLGSEGWTQHPCFLPLQKMEYDLPKLPGGQKERVVAWRATEDQTRTAYRSPFVQLDLPLFALTTSADWPTLPKPVIPEPIVELPNAAPEAPEPPLPETAAKSGHPPYARKAVLGLLAAVSFALGAGVATIGAYYQLNRAADEHKQHIVAANGRQKASEDEITRLRYDISRYSAEIEAKGTSIKNDEAAVGIIRADVRQRDKTIADQKATIDALNKLKVDLETRLKTSERAQANLLETRPPTPPVVTQAGNPAISRKYDDTISYGTLPYIAVFKDNKENVFIRDGNSLDIARWNSSSSCNLRGSGCWEVFNLGRYSFRCMTVSYPNTGLGERALGWGESNEEARKMANTSCSSKNGGALCSVNMAYSICR